MIEDGELERRPFFTCESCGLVFATHEEPRTCRVCDSSMFTAVYPVGPARDAP